MANITSIVLVTDDGARLEYDGQFFAVATQDLHQTATAIHCSGGVLNAGTAILHANFVHSELKREQLNRLEKFYFLFRYIRLWIRAFLKALKEKEIPHE